jgi:hypothetical protein
LHVVERVVGTLPLALCLVGALAVGGCHGSADSDDVPVMTVAVEQPGPADAAADGDSSGVTVRAPRIPMPKTGAAPPSDVRDAGVDFAASPSPGDAGTADGGITDAAVNDAPAAGDGLLAFTDMCGRIRCDCTLRGARLWGKVSYVLAGGDFKIRATLAPDLFVQQSFAPASCGEWAEVTVGADFTVQFVTAGEDFQIEFSSFPGVAKPPGAP